MKKYFAILAATHMIPQKVIRNTESHREQRLKIFPLTGYALFAALTKACSSLALTTTTNAAKVKMYL